MARQFTAGPQPAHRPKRRGVGEAAGGAAAECAAVCCCFPCAVLNLVVLAVYKVPKGLARKAADKRRRRLPKKNDDVLLHPNRSSSAVANEVTVGSTRVEELFSQGLENDKPEEDRLEKEMWARFAGTGFWRSDSQRQPLGVETVSWRQALRRGRGTRACLSGVMFQFGTSYVRVSKTPNETTTCRWLRSHYTVIRFCNLQI
ncbi:hypothetical protein CR513_53908, partial [Mucuna pruriens]